MARLVSRDNKEESVPTPERKSRIPTPEIPPTKPIIADITTLTNYNADRDLSMWEAATSTKGAKVSRTKKVFGEITYGNVEEAIWTSGGLITNIARKLSLSVYHVKNVLRKYPSLSKMFEEFREALIDEVECHLMDKIRNKQDTVAMIFMLKCLGKSRGWMEAPVASSRKAPVKIRIIPASKADAATRKKMGAQKTVLEFKRKVADGTTE